MCCGKTNDKYDHATTFEIKIDYIKRVMIIESLDDDEVEMTYMITLISKILLDIIINL